MKRVVLLLAVVLCAILGLTLREVSAAPPPFGTGYVLKQDSMVGANATPADTAQAVATPAVQMARPVAVPSEQVPRADSCRFDSDWHYLPVDSVRARGWRNHRQRPYQVRSTSCPLRPDPGRCSPGLVSRVG